MSDLSVSAQAQTCGTCANGTRRDNGFIRCPFLPRYTSMGEGATCAVTPSAWVAISPEKVAQRLAQEGIQRAVDAAEREHPGWAALAYEYVKLYAQQNQGKRFIGRDIVTASKKYGLIQPPNDKAFGKVIQRAARDGVIQRVGYAQDPNRHLSPVPEYTA